MYVLCMYVYTTRARHRGCGNPWCVARVGRVPAYPVAGVSIDVSSIQSRPCGVLCVYCAMRMYACLLLARVYVCIARHALCGVLYHAWPLALLSLSLCLSLQRAVVSCVWIAVQQLRIQLYQPICHACMQSLYLEIYSSNRVAKPALTFTSSLVCHQLLFMYPGLVVIAYPPVIPAVSGH